MAHSLKKSSNTKKLTTIKKPSPFSPSPPSPQSDTLLVVTFKSFSFLNDSYLHTSK